MLEPTLIIAIASLIGLSVVVAALLRAWQGWLSLKERELAESSDPADPAAPIGAARIEISDLKERIKKLEAIASGVEL
jgi:uncharacterized protein YecT (DUF1311 family)